MTRFHGPQVPLHKLVELRESIWTPARLSKIFLGYMSKMGANLAWWNFFYSFHHLFIFVVCLPQLLGPQFLLVCLDLVKMEGPCIEHNGYLCGRNPPVVTLNFSLHTSFAESSEDGATPPVLSLDAEFRKLFSILGIPYLSMTSMDGFSNSTPNPTHTVVVVTPSNSWWCTSCQDPFLLLN